METEYLNYGIIYHILPSEDMWGELCQEIVIEDILDDSGNSVLNSISATELNQIEEHLSWLD